ncbi:MAG: hypothetical protein E4G91_11795 [Candidatus Zixiibacteriota bacterium]|nr:MAG: hypothetical protein E4G91_11795 [candidate division Zixibacteria bacterium]
MKNCLKAVSLAFVMVFASCSDSGNPVKPDPTDRIRAMIAQTPRADTEVELAALWLSGEFVVSESLYVEMREALKAIRITCGSPFPLIGGIQFAHPWGTRQIMPLLSAQGMSDYRAGKHHDLDSLTELLNGETIDTLFFSLYDSFRVTIQFAGILNMDSVEVMYNSLSSVAGFDHYGTVGDGPNLYPWRLSDGRLTLLFRDAWGDCLSGCIYSHFWYFRMSGDSIEYVGDYVLDGSNPEPDWWSEGKAAYHKFRFD